MLFLMEEDEGREDSDRPLTLGWLLPVTPFPPWEPGLSATLEATFPRRRAGPDL